MVSPASHSSGPSPKSAAFGYGATKGAGFIHTLATSATEDTLGYLKILIRLLGMPPERLEQQLEAGGTT